MHCPLSPSSCSAVASRRTARLGEDPKLVSFLADSAILRLPGFYMSGSHFEAASVGKARTRRGQQALPIDSRLLNSVVNFEVTTLEVLWGDSHFRLWMDGHV
jgi:hypothetical protein